MQFDKCSEQVVAIKPVRATSPAATDDTTDPRSKQRTPLCFIIDSDASIRQFLSLILHGAGIATEEIGDGDALRAALARKSPDLVFLDVPLESAEAIASLLALSGSGYGGQVQLASSRGSAVLAHVKNVGEKHRLRMLPVLKKPFETNVIPKLLDELKLGHAPSAASQIDLDEILSNDWIEFWYQPKIDLRKKQLIGAEAFARARHPEHGLLMPGAFLPNARPASLVKLSEQALVRALEAGLKFTALGVNLRLAVNISAQVIDDVAVADIVQSYRPRFDKWPGLIIDVMEEQIIGNMALANAIASKLRPLDVRLAIDHFGRGYSSLSQLKELPFAEIKLDRSFVTDSSSDKVNAPLCKTVIDLAHGFGCAAVAMGIEKASDALALVRMGCDYGQGFLLGEPMPEALFLSLLRQRTAGHAREDTARGLEPQPA